MTTNEPHDTHGSRPDVELSEWMRRGSELVGRGSQPTVTQQLQSDWDSMATGETGSGTTDIIMNEVVNSWEHFTPVLGDWIQHGVDGAADRAPLDVAAST